MLHKGRVIAALEAQRGAFQGYDLANSQELTYYEDALARLIRHTREEVDAALVAIQRPGARPTSERLAGRHAILPFAPRWSNHHEARAWAASILGGVTTLSVDGSQIPPSRDFSIPVGAVQVGWFENPHDAEVQYTKDIHFEILPPQLLSDEAGEATDNTMGAFPDVMVNLRRFELECDVLARGLERLAGRQPTPICFFDGSLIISFAAQMRPDLRERYVASVHRLLSSSEDTRVPVVGYVANSYARDLVTMLACFCGQPRTPRISDGALLRARMAWGQRSECWACARDDQLFPAEAESAYYYEGVHFVYLKTTSDGMPARLEVPAWVLEDGLLERVADLVRAECIVGTGYPYAVETADALAVLTAQDREQFYRLFQDFVCSMDLSLRYSRKAYSKRGRR